MTARSSENSNDRLFCWEQVSRTNRLFRVSRVFAPAQCAERLLPLYALFSVIELIGSASYDEEVASSKLGWWRNEFLQQNRADSQHPLVKELNRTGAADMLSGESIGQLFNGVERRLSATAPADMGALRNTCIETFQPQLDLELATAESQLTAADFRPELLARNGMLQLLRESVQGKEQGSYWWIPLKSLARHGVSREDIRRQPGSPGAVQLLAELLGEAASWGRESHESPISPAKDYSSARHVFAISGLTARKLNRLAGIAPDRFQAELARLGPSDLFTAWNHARRLG